MTADLNLTRLMSGDDVAAYLGMARSTFDQKRKNLEERGMPGPVLNRDEFGSMKWDRHAIDAWLDHRSGLTAAPAAAAAKPEAWEEKLIMRAQQQFHSPQL